MISDSNRLQRFDILQTALAEKLIPEGDEGRVTATEIAADLVLFQDDGIAVHQNLQHVFRMNIKRAAELDRQDNTAEGIQLTDDACALHGKKPPSKFDNHKHSIPIIHLNVK